MFSTSPRHAMPCHLPYPDTCGQSERAGTDNSPPSSGEKGGRPLGSRESTTPHNMGVLAGNEVALSCAGNPGSQVGWVWRVLCSWSARREPAYNTGSLSEAGEDT